MSAEEFVRERRADWIELEALVAGARNPRRLGARAARRLAGLYRAAAADLAYARRRYADDPIVERLDALVRAARGAVYEHERPMRDVRAFVTTGYWRQVRERPVALAVAAALFLGSAALAGIYGWRDPGRAQGLVPDSYRSVTEPRETTDLGLATDEQAAFSSEIMTNNIRVTLLAFAGGIFAGVGTVLLLLFNGLQLGALAGLAISAGNARPFFALVSAHGVLELSCIVVAGSAGLRLGWATIDPGFRPRGEVVVEQARAAVELLVGTVPWLVLAALVEGFVTPRGLGLGVVLPVGLSLGALYWGLVLWRGRRSSQARGEASDGGAAAQIWPLALARR